MYRQRVPRLSSFTGLLTLEESCNSAAGFGTGTCHFTSTVHRHQQIPYTISTKCQITLIQCVQKKVSPLKHFALTSANMPRIEQNYKQCTRPEVSELLSPNFIRFHHNI